MPENRRPLGGGDFLTHTVHCQCNDLHCYARDIVSIHWVIHLL